MSELLPEHAGLLPYFLLMTGSFAFIHTVVSYLAPPPIATGQFKGAAAPAPHGLLGRVYGVKNMYTSLIRAFAAYHITNPELYTLAMFTYVGALGLYVSEVVVYKTTRLREAWIPFFMTGGGILWMMAQREFYTAA